jgi:hypothetical protein
LQLKYKWRLKHSSVSTAWMLSSEAVTLYGVAIETIAVFTSYKNVHPAFSRAVRKQQNWASALEVLQRLKPGSSPSVYGVA